MNGTAHRRAGGRELGWNPSGRAVGWAAVGGAVAALMTGIPMHMMGMMVTGPAHLVGSDNVWVGWGVHLLAGVLFGAPFGLLARPRAYGRGALRGALYGLLVGVLFAWLALFSILDMPLLSMTGALDVMMHVVWGALIGLVTTWGLRRASDGTHGRAHHRGAIR